MEEQAEGLNELFSENTASEGKTTPSTKKNIILEL